MFNSFLSLRLRTTKGYARSLFVGIDSNLNIPLSPYLLIRTLTLRRVYNCFTIFNSPLGTFTSGQTVVRHERSVRCDVSRVKWIEVKRFLQREDAWIPDRVGDDGTCQFFLFLISPCSTCDLCSCALRSLSHILIGGLRDMIVTGKLMWLMK